MEARTAPSCRALPKGTQRARSFQFAAGEGASVGDYGAGAAANQAPVATADPTALALRAHADQYADFLDAVEDGRPPLVTVADAITNIAVIRAIYRSAATGAPVTL